MIQVTDRIYMRFITPQDALVVYANIAASRDHLRNLAWADTATLASTAEYLRQVTQRPQDIVMGLFYQPNEDQSMRFAGMLEFRYQSRGVYQVGYWLSHTCRGRGIVTNALAYALLNFHGLRVVTAKTLQLNTKSQALLKKLGFQEEHPDGADPAWRYFAYHKGRGDTTSNPTLQ